MTFRLTRLLIFTLLVSSPVIVSTEPTTEEATTESSEAPITVPVTSEASTSVVVTTQSVCPNGYAYSAVNCENNGAKGCSAGEQCYREMREGNKAITACCSGLNDFCPSTGLQTRRAPGGKKVVDYLFTYDKDLDSGLWYSRTFKPASDAGVACPIPNSFTLVDRVVPLTWADGGLEKSKANDRSYTLERCKKNSDCGEGNFCDAVYNPSFGQYFLDESDNGKSLRFCFPLPKLDDQGMYDGQSMTHVAHDNGLKICGKQSHCGSMDEICHFTGKTYRNESDSKQVVSGLCVHIDACLKSDAQSRAVLNAGGQLCSSDDHCGGGGLSAGNQDYNPHCRSFLQKTEDRKVCCYEKNPDCRIGKAMTPIRKCTKVTDCLEKGKQNSDHWNTWCDDSGKNICCKDLNNQAWQCPDLATPLFNEPKCTGVIKDKENSGSCPKKAGKCLRGHCCPSLTISENGTKVSLGKNLYRTDFPCDPNSAPPNYFSYVFCNPEDNKLVVVGKYHDNGDAMTKVSGKKCTINADCSSDASSVCVYETVTQHVCYYNPLRPLRPPVSGFWKTVLIISLVCGGIFLVLSLICFVCYRSKSVFDKYKKKGKKGKGSGGKSSKASKKGGKKGGKKGKGKKGKKGDESSKTSSKSKKSKTKSKKETEKSEGTTGGESSSSQMN